MNTCGLRSSRDYPSKIICGFRCVCKSWNSIISSSFFINHHYSFTKYDSINKSYFLFNCDRQLNNESSFSLYNPQDSPPVEHIRFKRVPLQSQGFGFHVIDVVHGVVCLQSLSDGEIGSKSSVILWNPTIHKYVEIEEPINEDWLRLKVGFGFDARKNDFKVVRSSSMQGSTIEVFSIQRGGWKKSVVADHINPFPPCSSTYGRFINGSIHWIIRRYNSLVLLVFDCESEELKSMELGLEFNQLDTILSPVYRLYIYRGMLSVSASWLLMPQGGRETVIWVMEEYGVPSSWKKLKLDHKCEIVLIKDMRVYGLVCITDYYTEWKRTDVLKRSQHILGDNYDFQPSMFLMDSNAPTVSYTMNHDDEVGKVYFYKDES